MTDDFFGQDVSLVALAGDPGPGGDRRLVNVRFVDCEIRGPAVVRLGPGFVLASAAQFDTEQESALRPLAPGEDPPAGSILLDDCTMDGCRLYGIQVAADRALLELQFGDSIFGPDRQPYRPSYLGRD